MSGEREEPRQLQAETLFAAWASRVEAGEELDFDELVHANTELEPELRALHDDWKHFAPILGNVVPGLIASGDGLVLPSLTRGPDVDEEPPSDELLEKLGLHAPDTKRYRFRGRIGTGGQGVVLKVWDAKLSRPLAMKIVLGSAQDQPTGQTPRVDGRRLTRFVDEARIASQLNHPGIVPVHELGADESGRAFFTMKLVKGDDLSRIFEKVKRGEDGIGLPRAVSYLLRVCEAMAYAHARGVIHRDLKPANVMVGAYGEVHVMDWGLARVIGDAASDVSAPRAHATEPISQVDSVRRADRETTPGSVLATEHGDRIGTPCYMSPEQARGDNAAVGPQSDVYAVGAMLYQLLTGTPPYVLPGERVSGLVVLRQTIHGPPPPVESLAPRAIPELVAICERAMARDPAARYASMRDLASDLQAFLDGRVVRAYETGLLAETRKWIVRNPGFAVSVVVSAVMLGVVLGQNREIAAMDEQSLDDRYATSLAAATLGAAEHEWGSVTRALSTAPVERRDWEWHYFACQANDSIAFAKPCEHGSVHHLCFGENEETIVFACDGEFAGVWWHQVGPILLHRVPGGLVTAASLVERGSVLVTSDISGQLHLTNADSGQTPERVDFGSGIQTACPLNLSSSILVGLSDGRVVLQPVSMTAPGRVVVKHKKPITQVAIDPTDSLVLSVCRDGVLKASFLNNLSASIDLMEEVVDGAFVRVEPRGRSAAVVLPSGSIRMWTFTEGQALEPTTNGGIGRDSIGGMLPHSALGLICWLKNGDMLQFPKVGSPRHLLPSAEAPIGLCSATAEGGVLVAGQSNGVLRVWSGDPLRHVCDLNGPAAAVTALALSSNGEMVCAAFSNGDVHLWSVQSRLRLSAQTSLAANLGHAWDINGDQLAAVNTDGTIRIVCCITNQVLATIEGSDAAHYALFLLKDQQCAVVNTNSSVDIWRLKSGERTHVPAICSGMPARATASRDGARIALLYSDADPVVIDASRPVPIVRKLSLLSRTTAAGFSPTGDRLAIGNANGDVLVVDVVAGQVIGQRDALHKNTVLVCQFSEDGERVFTTSEDRTVSIWSPRSGQVVASLPELDESVVGAVADHDLSRLLTWTADGAADLWSLVEGRPKSILHFESALSVVGAAMSPSSNRALVWSSRDLRVVDTSKGLVVARLANHPGGLSCVRFDSTGERLWVETADGAIRCLDSQPTSARLEQARLVEYLQGQSQPNAVSHLLRRKHGNDANALSLNHPGASRDARAIADLNATIVRAMGVLRPSFDKTRWTTTSPPKADSRK
jgi:serine/threonine protein kinase/WD40 repeat protein